jgi:acetyl-CoA carboxylase biotin carboxylase subunit
MFSRLLIANRGEIAVRIIRACYELGIETVAVYSTADQGALHTQMADVAVCIGGPSPKESYLNAQAILTAASITQCDAIHPGFGFLAENAEFAHMTQSCGFVFVGPSPDVIALMGDKIEARRQAKLAGVPITPGSEGAVNSVSEAQSICERLGFPVMIKAAAGGGGRGMRIASDREQLPGALRTARAEAKSFFADDRVYIETLVQNPRHIEVQLLGDRYGNVVHFGERDCSLQRRNQKLIEEAPSPFADPRLREALGNASVRLAKQVGYEGVGTIEYLVDDKRNFYFMEMNTRIQVEHPVTEETTDFDLIKLQIESAAGAVLDIRQSEIAVKGHSIECRINAEDPGHDFRPTPGRIDFVHFPGGRGVRVDSAIFSGYEVPSDYDNLLAKIIVHGKTRTEATLRMRRALLECQITGPATNIDFLLSVLREEDFVEGRIDIGWLGRNLDRLTESRDLPDGEKSSAY